MHRSTDGNATNGNATNGPAEGVGPTVAVSKADLVVSWRVLENVVVSLAAIGRAFGQPDGGPDDENVRRQMLDAMDMYLTPELLRELGRARRRLGEYIPDDEAEAMAEREIPYWSYESFKAEYTRGCPPRKRT